MDELRFVRREEHTLILANDADKEFRFIVDDAALLELRHLAKRPRDAARVSPKEIQALIRAGKSRSQVAEETGLGDDDIDRYAEPVLAERRYILERAQAVPVRIDAHDDSDHRFGAVIAERLIAIGADASDWSSWRDAETGWMISLEFISHDVAHRAVWSFEHRKGTLSPISPDAVNLSKQGDVGDRLIPKLRAVDDREQSGQFDEDAFDADQLDFAVPKAGQDDAEPDDAADSGGGNDGRAGRGATPSPALTDPDAEYERRREIDQRAISSDSSESGEGTNFSQTADLLDALRKRRGEREQHGKRGAFGQDTSGADAEDADADRADDAAPRKSPAHEERSTSQPRSIWAAAGVSGTDEDRRTSETSEDSSRASQGSDDDKLPNPGPSDSAKAESDRPAKKGRASVPSWDDILFGTRSDEDPA